MQRYPGMTSHRTWSWQCIRRIWSDEKATQNRTVSKIEKTKGQWTKKEDSQQKYLGTVMSKTLVGINPDFIDVQPRP